MLSVQIGGASTRRHSAEAVGDKAANLARAAAIGLPVPPAFVLPVKQCTAMVNGDPDAQQKLIAGLTEGIAFLENITGLRFGDRRRPLLVSVRSGAARSMPGMLDTVLHVGCTASAVHGLVRMTGNPRFAWDCRRRFLNSYARVVLGLEPSLFSEALTQALATEGVEHEVALDGEALERLAERYQQIVEDQDGIVPDDPMEQLKTAAHAVYRSWTSKRARTYRRLQHLEALQGTAVTIQAMVFGNRSLTSGAGVAFSRDPSTGDPQPIIDVLFGSQGEDVVSGTQTPQTDDTILQSAPSAAKELRQALARLEDEFRDVQGVEFTIEDGRLWILQTRAAQRTPEAALRFAIDFVRQGRITPAEGLRRIDGLDLSSLGRQRLAGAAEPVAHGTPASAGIAIGRAAFDAESGCRLAVSGDSIILVRRDTGTEDVAGFALAAGILTAVGGRTAHAALVARQMGKPCVVGCAALAIDATGRSARLANAAVNEGDWLTIDGGTGAVYLDRHEVVIEQPEAELAEVAQWRQDPLRCKDTFGEPA